MDFFSRSRLAPEVTDDANREIVVRRIPCEGLVSNIVCEWSGRLLIEVTRALALK
jgi:hypothetical protein